MPGSFMLCAAWGGFACPHCSETHPYMPKVGSCEPVLMSGSLVRSLTALSSSLYGVPCEVEGAWSTVGP